MKIKDDNTIKWHNFFAVRLDYGLGYYIGWLGKPINAFPDKYFQEYQYARDFICKPENWRSKIDEEFEKEILQR